MITCRGVLVTDPFGDPTPGTVISRHRHYAGFERPTSKAQSLLLGSVHLSELIIGKVAEIDLFGSE